MLDQKDRTCISQFIDWWQKLFQTSTDYFSIWNTNKIPSNSLTTVESESFIDDSYLLIQKQIKKKENASLSFLSDLA